MKKQTKTLFAIVAIVAAVGLLAVSVATSNLAYAKIGPSPSGCTNPGGNSPGGQQPECNGGGLTQHTENTNPAGIDPPGKNK
jgi:hypothetical protein